MSVDTRLGAKKVGIDYKLATKTILCYSLGWKNKRKHPFKLHITSEMKNCGKHIYQSVL